ncbi:DUF4974 domain-containing protein [Cellulophaga baltica]|uniref:FecR family protein n=1 Tax=Cellulophaga TaxID=104264 RepID=UPI001C06F792|nr:MULTISPECIES: FecR domain-containing protein [Cellulophaga]MBU2997192.1 DUF4974 domain-containing protein [Cellulophaga baltica]MDO6768590.1 DUF4974 domain-containing protein [Cellulophaga sp. 1_MG-2023]
MKNNQLSNSEISKFLKDAMTPSELEAFKNKLTVADNLEALKKYFVLNHLIEVEAQSFDSDVAFEKFLARKIDYNSSLENSFFSRNRTYLYVAASFCLLFALSILIYFNYGYSSELEVSNQIVLKLDSGEEKALDESKSNKIYNTEGKVVAVQKGNSILYNYSDNKEEITKPEFNEIYVPYGKRMEVVLSDGTRAYLNSGSFFKYPTYFNSNEERVVELKGEAYFDVAKKDKKNRFVVHTKNFQTTVLGTEFNISSYTTDTANDIVLIEGSVKVNFNTQGEFILKPGEQFKYSKDKIAKVNIVDVQNYIAWLDGVLLFENEKFNSISKKLERFYNVSIENNCDSLVDEKFTGQFDLETIEEVLKTFNNTVPFNFKIENRKITINPLNS